MSIMLQIGFDKRLYKPSTEEGVMSIVMLECCEGWADLDSDDDIIFIGDKAYHWQHAVDEGLIDEDDEEYL